jgi:hypothetical protein
MAEIVKITLEAEDKTSGALQKLQSGIEKADSSIQEMVGSLCLIKWVVLDEIGRTARDMIRILKDFGILSSHTSTEEKIKGQNALAAGGPRWQIYWRHMRLKPYLEISRRPVRAFGPEGR